MVKKRTEESHVGHIGHSTERWQKGSYTYEASGRMATVVVVALAAEIGEGRIGSIGSKSDGALYLLIHNG
ncbi:hypothetical protein ILYODFUR_006407 [Ilyodon furcidens]|uniref:Uncharacterized protein n=1 Tax=Ilyodon furcidens TaxID=33524 RepID=A0ABV0VBN5_9TELE